MGSSQRKLGRGASATTACAGAQPLGHRSDSRRLVGRQRRRRGRAPDAGGDRHRHRRLDPPARSVLRHHRHQAHLWPRLALRHGGLCLQPGPGRPHGAQRRRLRAAAVAPCAAPTRTATPPRWTVPGRRLRPHARTTRWTACALACPQEFFGEGLAPRRARCGATRRLAQYEKLGAKLVPITLPRTELSIPVYYIIAPAEASQQPEPL